MFRKKDYKYEVIYLALMEIVPPTGFEPVHLPPEGSALSPELRGPVLLQTTSEPYTG